MKPVRIFIHHSLTKDSGTVSCGAIRRYHTETLGWATIGYHALTELVISGGRLYYETLMGRMWDTPGAHVRGQNSDSLGLCFPTGSKVFGNPLVKEIQDLKIGDTVLGNGKFTKIKNVISRCYSGKMVKVIPANLPHFSLTANHPVKVVKNKFGMCLFGKANRCRPKCSYKERGGKVGKCARETWKNWQPEWRQASSLTRNDFLVFPKYKPQIESKIDLAKYVTPHYLVTENEIICKSGKRHKYPRFLKVDDDVCRFLGWYVAEGNSYGKDVRITQGKRKAEAEIACAEFVKRLGIKSKTYEGYGRTPQIIITSKLLANFLDSEFGHGSRNKKIPRFILDLDTKRISTFINAYQRGDGYEYRYGNTMVTYSEALAYGLVLLFNKLGVVASFQERKPEGFAIEVYSKRNRSRWFDDRNNFYVPILKVSQENYIGDVYNIETEDNTYCAPVLVHNCFIGNYDQTKPEDEMLITGAKLIRLWMRLFDIKIDEIYGHRDFSTKSCPGDRFDMNKLKSYIELEL